MLEAKNEVEQYIPVTTVSVLVAVLLPPLLFQDVPGFCHATVLRGTMF